MPDDWPAEALKAQAVVARSYALSHLHGGAFDLYPDTRSQVYLGVPEEVDSTSAAVNATAGQVVLYKGRWRAPTTTRHRAGARRRSRTSGRARRPVPYLVSVPDPYDTASPYHDWGPITISRERLGQLLKVQGPLMDAPRPSTGRSGSTA